MNISIKTFYSQCCHQGFGVWIAAFCACDIGEDYCGFCFRNSCLLNLFIRPLNIVILP